MILTKDMVFDYDSHNKNFINYLEVIIFKDGHIEYAVPSHQMKLIDIYCKENNISYNELVDTIPIEEDILYWLIYNTGCVSVWYNFAISSVNITKNQKETLKMLSVKKCINKNYSLDYIYKEDSTGWLRILKRRIENG